MTKEFLMSVFPNYTEAMYEGNEPCRVGHELVSGGHSDRWECRYGVAETNGDEIISASWIINHKVNIFICGELLWITDIRHSGKLDVWDYTSDGEIRFIGNMKYHHDLEPERIEATLGKEYDCKLWKLVQARAWTLYNNSKNKTE